MGNCNHGFKFRNCISVHSHIALEVQEHYARSQTNTFIYITYGGQLQES